jgi:hypothetical protein
MEDLFANGGLRMRTDMPDMVTQCIYWSMLSLHKDKQSTLESEKIREHLLTTFAIDRNLSEKEVASGKDMVMADAVKAEQCLLSKSTLYLTENDGNISGILPGEISDDMRAGLSVIISMRNMEQLFHFSLAIDMLAQEKKSEFLKNISNETFTHLHNINLKVEAFFHRLIPLNNFRCKMLENIADDHHFLFPWYFQWSDKAPDTLNNYVYYMADESDDTFSPDPLLDAVLLNDKPFYDRLIEEAMLIRELPLALAEDPVYQMLKEVDKIVYAKDLPDEIIAAGRVDAAIRVATEDILDDIPEKEWRMNAALLGIGLNDSEREELLASIYTDHHDEMVEHNLEKCIADQLERLQNVSHRGFYRIPECHMIYNMLLTSKNPKLLAGMIRAWDMAGGFARAALKGMTLIFGLPANILDQLTDNVSDTFSQPLIRYPLATDRGQEDGDQRTAEFPLDLFPTDPLPMPEVINEIRRGQQHHYIRIMGDESLQCLRQKMESFLNLHWGGFAFFDGGFDQLGPDTGIPNRLSISTEKQYRLIILFFHPDGDLIKQALNGSEIAERSVGIITYVRKTGATR